MKEIKIRIKLTIYMQIRFNFSSKPWLPDLQIDQRSCIYREIIRGSLSFGV